MFMILGFCCGGSKGFASFPHSDPNILVLLEVLEDEWLFPDLKFREREREREGERERERERFSLVSNSNTHPLQLQPTPTLSLC